MAVTQVSLLHLDIGANRLDRIGATTSSGEMLARSENIRAIFPWINLVETWIRYPLFGAGIGRAAGYATGLIVSNDGHIVTANSVILTGERIRVVTHDGKIHKAKLVRRDIAVRTAVLKIDATTPDHFTLLDKLPAAKGDWVLCVSNAFKVAEGKEPLSVNLGIVSLVTRVDTKRGQFFHVDWPEEGRPMLEV